MSRSYGSSSGSIRTTSRRKVAVSYVIRDVEEKLNRSGVNKLRLDPTHKLLYTAGRDSIIRSWDLSQLDSSECAHRKSFEHHTDWVNDIVLCIDGKYIMSASSDTTIKLWDTNKGSCSSTLRTHKDYVRCLAYAKETEVVASAGLDKSIYLWDIKTLTSLTSSNNTITTTSVTGQKESVYSMVMNDAGSVLVCGSTEKLLRVWDPRTCEKQMKLKGHTDNVRALLLNRDGTMCLSGSSDGTVRLWSLGQQRCVETFRIHEEGVWALAADEEFTMFYSGGKDKKVYATELLEGCQEGTLLLCEDSPVLSLALDTTGSTDALWVATTDTKVNKWSVDPNQMVQEDDGLVNGVESEEEELMVTNIDEPTPMFTKPAATLPGGSSIKDFRILNNRQQVLTRDSDDNVALWDVLHARKIEDLGRVNMDDEASSRQERYYVPNWFNVEVKTGMLTIRLEELECFSAWVIGSRTNVEGVAPDLKMNLGALLLHALFEHWPSTHPPPEEKVDQAALAPSPPPPPQVEELLEICAGCDNDVWEKLAAALCIPEEEVEKIKYTNPNKPEKCLEDLFKIWVKEAEDVTWDRFSESLTTAGQDELAERVKERLSQYNDLQRGAKEKEKAEVKDPKDYHYFSVPKHTPVVLAESGDCGTTLVRFLCGDAGGNHETRQLNNMCPVWIMDIVCQKKLPGQIKTNFTLVKYTEEQPKTKGKDDRLSAQDLLSIRKVQEYVCPKLFGNKDGKVDNLDEKVDRVEILCMDQVLDPELDLRTVKYSIWKSSGDVKLLFREKASPSLKEENEQEESSAQDEQSDQAKADD